ncbi:NUDIX domain-containing protein [Demequina sp.]|uniref:NUDIX hydrolase n=1 Tax=Demequina sp. TaxID=2050685 RepID=UPI0025FB0E70|nr:NUDIX domain-containing protein [Demequina sp.]
MGDGPGPDAASSPRIEREGARVLLFDGHGRMLLLRGHDPHLPDRSWWFTPGGGLDAGESPREAAARELAEETGHLVGSASLVGPVWERTAFFDFLSRPYVQHEWFFVAHVDDADEGDARWTATEEETLDEVAWLTYEELVAAEIEIFPAQLREPWESLRVWDGTLRRLGTVEE